MNEWLKVLYDDDVKFTGDSCRFVIPIWKHAKRLGMSRVQPPRNKKRQMRQRRKRDDPYYPGTLAGELWSKEFLAMIDRINDHVHRSFWVIEKTED